MGPEAKDPNIVDGVQVPPQKDDKAMVYVIIIIFLAATCCCCCGIYIHCQMSRNRSSDDVAIQLAEKYRSINRKLFEDHSISDPDDLSTSQQELERRERLARMERKNNGVPLNMISMDDIGGMEIESPSLETMDEIYAHVIESSRMNNMFNEYAKSRQSLPLIHN